MLLPKKFAKTLFFTALCCLVMSLKAITPEQLAVCFDCIHEELFANKYSRGRIKTDPADAFIVNCINTDCSEEVFKETFGFARDLEGLSLLKYLCKQLQQCVLMPVCKMLPDSTLRLEPIADPFWLALSVSVKLLKASDIEGEELVDELQFFKMDIPILPVLGQSHMDAWQNLLFTFSTKLKEAVQERNASRLVCSINVTPTFLN